MGEHVCYQYHSKVFIVNIDLLGLERSDLDHSTPTFLKSRPKARNYTKFLIRHLFDRLDRKIVL